MSRFAKTVVAVSNDVEVMIKDRMIVMRGKHGVLTYNLHDLLDCNRTGNCLSLSFREKNKKFVNVKSLLGTTYALLRAMLIGVTVGYTKQLQLVGVGYRSVLKGSDIIVLTIGFSHVVNYKFPNNVNVTCPTPVDIVLNSPDKQLVGKVAADLRAIRPPEPFSGKGIRYLDEVLRIKQVKKK